MFFCKILNWWQKGQHTSQQCQEHGECSTNSKKICKKWSRAINLCRCEKSGSCYWFTYRENGYWICYWLKQKKNRSFSWRTWAWPRGSCHAPPRVDCWKRCDCTTLPEAALDLWWQTEQRLQFLSSPPHQSPTKKHTTGADVRQTQFIYVPKIHVKQNELWIEIVSMKKRK